jgi:hypothetical protein
VPAFVAEQQQWPFAGRRARRKQQACGLALVVRGHAHVRAVQQPVSQDARRPADACHERQRPAYEQISYA